MTTYSANQTAFDFLDASSRGIWRVWRDSYKKWLLVPLPRRTLRRYYREAQRFNMTTGGALGGSALRVLYEMIEHFADELTGELTPSKQQLATRLGLCVRTVANALDRLRAFGIIDWVRRCIDDKDARGRFMLKQISNAYSIKAPESWRGYRAVTEPLRPKAELIQEAAAEAPQPRRAAIWKQPAPSWADMVAHYQANPSRLAGLLGGN
jgi:Helix-turn-helix domain